LSALELELMATWHWSKRGTAWARLTWRVDELLGGRKLSAGIPWVAHLQATGKSSKLEVFVAMSLMWMTDDCQTSQVWGVALSKGGGI